MKPKKEVGGCEDEGIEGANIYYFVYPEDHPPPFWPWPIHGPEIGTPTVLQILLVMIQTEIIPVPSLNCNWSRKAHLTQAEPTGGDGGDLR